MTNRAKNSNIPFNCLNAGCPGRERIEILLSSALSEQGLDFKKVKRGYTRELDKESIRNLNRTAVAAKRANRRKGLERYEDYLLTFFASGSEVDPDNINPRLVEVGANSCNELLFRYATLHWSIPVSSGYGRRLRFVVFDDANNKLIGVLGLGDPVYSLRDRDQWIGWDPELRKRNLRHVMDAFVLGAVPPYNKLLFGKLIALLATAKEVQEAFKKKYSGSHSLITRRDFEGELALVTTASALGRSSIYNRLTYHKQKAFYRVGKTGGSGEYHFSNGVYNEILAFAKHHCRKSWKANAWGSGWRNRREVIRAVLGQIGWSRELLYHGIQRELYVAPLAQNSRNFLIGRDQVLYPFERNLDNLFDWFSERWLRRRARTNESYRSFNPEELRIWRADHG